MSKAPSKASHLLRQIASSSVGNMALPLSALVTGPLLARALAPEGRGLMVTLLAPISLANLMFTLGVPDSMTYHVAKGNLKGRNAVKIGLTGGIVCGVIASAVMLLATPYLLRKLPQYLPEMHLLILTLPVSLGFASLRGIVQGRHQFGVIRNERFIGVLFRLSLLAAFVLGGLLNPVNATWISVLSAIAGSGILIPTLCRFSREPSSGACGVRVAKYASATAVGTLGGLLVVRLDQTLMISLTTHAQLGYYAVAASLADVPLTVVAGIRDVSFTFVAEHGDPRLAARLCRVTLLLIGLVCLAVGLLSPKIIPLLFGQEFRPSIRMVQILLFGTVASTVTAILGAGLMSMGKPWILSRIQFSGAALTAALLFMFVPHGGGLAASWVTSITYTTLALVSLSAYSYCSRVRVHECLIPTRLDLSQIRWRPSRSD